MFLTQLETPALVADRKAFRDNLQVMQSLLEGKKLRLRPHFKSNKCTAIAHMQLESGAKGITCAKLSEAEELIDAGIEDVLIANQLEDPAKIARAALLAGRCHLTVCTDREENAEALSRAAVFAGTTLYCYVEYEIGMQRCGVLTEDAAVLLARKIDSLPGLVFAGLQAYAGHVSHMESEAERRACTEKSAAELRRLIARLEAEGLPVKEVSGGSTGTAAIKAEDGLYTELQAGSYIFLDNTYGRLEKLPFRQSLYVLAQVVSRRPGLTVLDAGAKTLGMDQGDPAVMTLGGRQIRARIEVNEEHLKLLDPSEDLPLGAKVLLIPGHCCSTVNLFDKLYFFEDGKIVDRIPVSARGCSR